MKIIKVYQKFITEKSFNKESVIDELNRKELEKKIASGKKLNLTDIIANQDVYCGNYTNPEDDTEVCGYHYGEAVEGKRDEWAEKMRGMKCPGCGEVVGNLVEYISPDDLDSYEAKLPGGGFYIFSKGTEDKELLTNNPDNTKSSTTTSKSSTTPIDVKSEEDGEKPPKWVKNPKSWAMDKIVSLLTPENINQIANCYISSGIFDFKELDNLKSNMKAIYQSSKNKKESDVTDHIRRFGIKSIKGVHYLKGDKNKIAEKFENLLRYFQK